MTVSMRVMSAGSGYQYLLKSVAAGDGNRNLSTPLTRYYTEAGTPPGQWLGSGVHALGNGEIKQQGDLNQLIWKVPEMISYLSGLFVLQPGDLIMSGTPSGVGPVKRGDVMEGFCEGVAAIKAKVV